MSLADSPHVWRGHTRVHIGSIIVHNLQYVNDMVPSVTCDIFLYTDDTTLIISGKDQVEIELRLNKDLASLSVWLEENKLSLHLARLKASYLPLSKD